MTSSPDRRARGGRLRFASLRENVAARLWPIPVMAVAVAVILGFGLPVVDEAVADALPGWLAAVLFSGGPDAARAVLSAIASSLMAATTLTFSLTVVALQLASSQASPRVLRMFARDRIVHRTLAVFLGTFAYALTVLRTVRDETLDEPGVVPPMAITLAFLLTLASVVTLVLFLSHLARILRIETVMRDVHRETTETLALVRGAAGPVVDPDDADAEPTDPPQAPEVPPHARPVLATRSGFLTRSDRERLVRLGVEHDIVVAETRSIGSNVVDGTPIAFWWSRDPLRHAEPDDAARIDREVSAAFGIGYERTPTQDVGFGLRQLADISVRAVSPGVNDPTTAVHALGHISGVLCELVRLPEQLRALDDDAGVVRVIPRRHEFASLLEVGVQQTRRYGGNDPDVVIRLYGVLREVAYASERPGDRAVLAEQIDRLDATVAGQDFDPTERAVFADASASARAALTGEWR